MEQSDIGKACINFSAAETFQEVAGQLIAATEVPDLWLARSHLVENPAMCSQYPKNGFCAAKDQWERSKFISASP